jgi:hypothetical protein
MIVSNNAVRTISPVKHAWLAQVTTGIKSIEDEASEGRLPAPLQRAHLRAELEPGKYVLRLVYAPDDWLSKASTSGWCFRKTCMVCLKNVPS